MTLQPQLEIPRSELLELQRPRPVRDGLGLTYRGRPGHFLLRRRRLAILQRVDGRLREKRR